jgi:hypothetical protein
MTRGVVSLNDGRRYSFKLRTRPSRLAILGFFSTSHVRAKDGESRRTDGMDPDLLRVDLYDRDYARCCGEDGTKASCVDRDVARDGTGTALVLSDMESGKLEKTMGAASA